MSHSQPQPQGTLLKRRDLMRLGAMGAALMSPLLAATARAADEVAIALPEPAPPAPVVDARFPSQIADGIWIIPDRRVFLVPNIGIVEGSKKVLVIDSGFTAGSGRDVFEAARQIAGKREIVLTVTHAHPEHTFGAMSFRGHARIFTNKLQRDYLARRGADFVAGFRPFLPPDQRYLLDDIRVTLADEVYAGRFASMDLGGRRVDFRTWGKAHSPGDQIISVPDQNVIFMGDLIEERMFPIVPFFPPLIEADEIDLRQWEIVLTQIIAERPRLIVPGHGNLGGVEIVRSVRNYFTEIRQLVATSQSGNATSQDAIARLVPVVQRRHPTWEHAQFIAPALSYLEARI